MDCHNLGHPNEYVRYTMDWEAGAPLDPSSAPEILSNVKTAYTADPLPLFSWPGRDEMGDDTVLHRYTIYLHFSHNWPLFISI